MAKIFGVPKTPRGRYWLRASGTVRPANDQAGRILTAAGVQTWPIYWELHTSGLRLAVPNAVMADGVSDGDYIDIPATAFGVSQIIGPRVIIEGTFWDNLGVPSSLRLEGVIQEDSNGEWNINSLMQGDAFPTGTNTSGGAAAGAITTAMLGSVAPSQAQFTALYGEAHIAERYNVDTGGSAGFVARYESGLQITARTVPLTFDGAGNAGLAFDYPFVSPPVVSLTPFEGNGLFIALTLFQLTATGLGMRAVQIYPNRTAYVGTTNVHVHLLGRWK